MYARFSQSWQGGLIVPYKMKVCLGIDHRSIGGPFSAFLRPVFAGRAFSKRVADSGELHYCRFGKSDFAEREFGGDAVSAASCGICCACEIHDGNEYSGFACVSVRIQVRDGRTPPDAETSDVDCDTRGLYLLLRLERAA